MFGKGYFEFIFFIPDEDQGSPQITLQDWMGYTVKMPVEEEIWLFLDKYDEKFSLLPFGIAVIANPDLIRRNNEPNFWFGSGSYFSLQPGPLVVDGEYHPGESYAWSRLFLEETIWHSTALDSYTAGFLFSEYDFFGDTRYFDQTSFFPFDPAYSSNPSIRQAWDIYQIMMKNEPELYQTGTQCSYQVQDQWFSVELFSPNPFYDNPNFTSIHASIMGNSVSSMILDDSTLEDLHEKGYSGLAPWQLVWWYVNEAHDEVQYRWMDPTLAQERMINSLKELGNSIEYQEIFISPEDLDKAFDDNPDVFNLEMDNYEITYPMPQVPSAQTKEIGFTR